MTRRLTIPVSVLLAVLPAQTQMRGRGAGVVPIAPAQPAQSNARVSAGATTFRSNRGFVSGAIGIGHNPRFFFATLPPFHNDGVHSTITPFTGYGYPYYYPAYYFEYPFGTAYRSIDEYNGKTVAQQQPNNNGSDAVAVLAEQISDLRAEISRLEFAQSQAASTPLQPHVEEQPTVTLVLRSNERLQVRNYAISGHSLWIFDGQVPNRIPLSQLDIPATNDANSQNGVTLVIPD
jgi:hypothetical protein